MRSTLVPILPLILFTTACGDSGNASETGSDTGTSTAPGTDTEPGSDTDPTGGAAAGPTYWDDVAPIFFSNCVTCHQAGGVGPFVLDSYAEAKKWAPATAASVEARTMPPWLVTDDGTCGTFEGSKALAQTDIDTIRAWLDAGTPEGTPRSDLQAPAPETLTNAVEFKTPVFSPAIQGGALAEFDEYRCFKVDTKLAADRFLTGYSVKPGVPAMIHHVLAITVDPEQTGAGGKKNSEIIAALDAESPDRDGWPCFGAAGDGVNSGGIPVSWAPGQGVTSLPEGIGFRIKKDDYLILQVHYNLVDPALAGVDDQTALQVRFADTVEREGFFNLPDDFLGSLYSGTPDQLEPGKAAVTYTFDHSLDYLPFLGAQEADLYGILPHMHQRGRKFRVELIEDGGAPQCATDVKAWDFNWQLFYFFDKPFPLTTKSKLRITCEFDTQSATEPVLPGWGTQNEMCLAGLFIVPK